MLAKKGIFTHHPDGVNAYNRSEVKLWRGVLDQSLRDATNNDAEGDKLREGALSWFHSTPGVIRTFEDDQGKYTVDEFEEFEEVCSRANLDISFVRKTWLEIYRRCLNDE